MAISALVLVFMLGMLFLLLLFVLLVLLALFAVFTSCQDSKGLLHTADRMVDCTHKNSLMYRHPMTKALRASREVCSCWLTMAM